MKIQSQLKIENMTIEELNLAVKWAAAENWNPGLHDADTFFATDPHGFFTAKLGDEVVGFISGVSYDDTYGFAGFYIVRPDLRGQNIGHALVEKAGAYLGARNIGTDGVVAEQENYKKMGFKFAYKNFRYRGEVNGVLSQNARVITPSEFNEITEFDKNFFPVDRSRFLKSWLFQKESVALYITKRDSIAGYGVIRPAHEGSRIGPLFCSDPQIADDLLNSLAATSGSKKIFLDVPEKNSNAMRLVERFKFEMVFETARMYSKEEPNVKIDGVYGVTTFELG